MRKKLLGAFAALSMIFTGVAASVAPVDAQAQSYRSDRGSYGARRLAGPRRGYRGYRGGRDYRGYRGRGYRATRGRGYLNDRRAYRSYRNDRRGSFDRGRRYRR